MGKDDAAAAARKAWEAGRHAEAEEAFLAADMPYEAALCREAVGDKRGALSLLQGIPPEHRSWRLAYAKTILLALEQGSYDFEIDRLAQRFAFAGPADPRELSAYLALADHYTAGARLDAARSVLERVLQWDPGNPDATARMRESGPAPARQPTPAGPASTRRRSVPMAHAPTIPLQAVRASTPPASVRPDEIVNGRYRLIEKIGQGVTGAVWRARDLEADQEIALKILPEPPGSTSWLGRIKQELAVSRRLTHKNVVRVHDIATWGRSKIISMELLRGRTLDAVLAEGAPPWQRSIEILIQVCAALRAAHEEGIVHRDIKPDNVFVCTDGVVKIMDFGIARADDGEEGRRVTRAGVLVGTPEYMAPEQIEDAKRAGPAADLYATGVMMYQLFTGRVPFDGAPLAVLVAHTERPPAPPRQWVPDLPESIEKIILELLEKSPDQRVPSATELARRLRASLRELR